MAGKLAHRLEMYWKLNLNGLANVFDFNFRMRGLIFTILLVFLTHHGKYVHFADD